MTLNKKSLYLWFDNNYILEDIYYYIDHNKTVNTSIV